MHLRQKSFKRARSFGRSAIPAKVHFDRLISRSEIERLLEWLG